MTTPEVPDNDKEAARVRLCGRLLGSGLSCTALFFALVAGSKTPQTDGLIAGDLALGYAGIIASLGLYFKDTRPEKFQNWRAERQLSDQQPSDSQKVLETTRQIIEVAYGNRLEDLVAYTVILPAPPPSLE